KHCNTLQTSGDTQLAKAKTQRDSVGAVSVKYVWKPSTQQSPTPPVLFSEKRYVLENSATLSAPVVKRPALISFTTISKICWLKNWSSRKTTVRPSTALLVKYVCTLVVKPFTFVVVKR